jgi:hypothetical protein
MSDPPMRAQSAELQTRWPAAEMTIDTNAVPMLNRHGCASPEMACTVKRGVAPIWYQYCGDDRRSVTSPGAQARARPAPWDGAALRRGDGCESGRAEGDDVAGEDVEVEDAAGAVSRLTCAATELAAVVPPDGWPWSAVERAASIPLAAHPMLVSSPMPTARTITRRRQYVACEGLGGWARTPRRGSGLPR